MGIKRTIMIIILFFFFFNNINLVLADDIDEELEYSFVYEETEEVISSAIDEPNILSKTAVIYDRNSKTALWGKDEEKRVPMASTTNVISYQR